MLNLDYMQLIKASRKIIKNDRGFPEVKIAILGDSSTQQLVQVLKALLYQNQVFADIYEADFDLVNQEIYDENSKLYQFRPDYTVLHVSMQKIRDDYYREGPGQVAAGEFIGKHSRVVEEWWKMINGRLNCRIIQNLYEIPLERPLGNFSNKLDGSFISTVRKINQSITESARSFANVFLNDIDYLASLFGKKQWQDEKLWIHAKIFCNPQFLPFVAKNITDVILAGLGRSKKCIVLDLDNTLWGGIIGDDGMSNIEVGGEGLGEAFSLFQHYLRDLKHKGILLAVCSKNDTETAAEPFQKHPGMVLKYDDIAVFTANWSPKSENIRNIAKALNIGLDSLVFLDDSSFEREEVKTALPEVCVPQLPEDPSEYVSCLNTLNLFESLSYSKEDAQRARYYKEELSRGSEKAKFTNIDDYLKSLEMKGEFNRFGAFHLPRIAQLIQRSNQFNLTTRRYNEKECESFMNDAERYFPAYITLKDKLGDSGLIGVVILRFEGPKAIIDQWLMSCRVLSRGVEWFTMNKVIAVAESKNCREIEGAYIPTPKNKMVEKFYGQFGFQKTATENSGMTTWKLKVSDYAPGEVFIRSIGENAWQAQESWKS